MLMTSINEKDFVNLCNELENQIADFDFDDDDDDEETTDNLSPVPTTDAVLP